MVDIVVTPSRRIHLTAVAACLAVLSGVLLGLLVPRILTRTPAPVLAGDFVLRAGQTPAPAFHLEDQSSREVSLSSLQGRVVVLTFLDTQCRQLCPLQADLLAKVQSSLGSRPRLTIVVVSVRPDADTPAAIAMFESAHHLRGPILWLKGTPAQLQPVWNAYGIAVRAAGSDLAHTSVIYLIDPHGYERVGFSDVPEASMLETDVRLLAAQGSSA